VGRVRWQCGRVEPRRLVLTLVAALRAMSSKHIAFFTIIAVIAVVGALLRPDFFWSVRSGRALRTTLSTSAPMKLFFARRPSGFDHFKRERVDFRKTLKGRVMSKLVFQTFRLAFSRRALAR
jgi:hypothetical protein